MGSGGGRFRPMGASDLGRLGEFDRTTGGSAPAEPHAWVSRAIESWDICGVLAQVDHRVIGFAALVPGTLATLIDHRASHSGSPDADRGAVLVDLRVLPDHRGRGVGRQLVQTAASELVKRGVTGLEAIGRSVPRTEPLSSIPTSAVQPIATDFLLAVGFRIVAARLLGPRLRMELSATARWRPDFSRAWQRLTGIVAQPIPPQPANRDSGLATRES